MGKLKRFLIREDAATAVEYAVMLAMILLALIGAVRALGDSNNGMWGKNVSEMEAHGL